MRNQDNPYFGKAFVNRVWAAYFNVGIIEPPDDLSLGNPPSNAPLLDWLTREFIAHEFDMKWLHKTIALSNTYQASWRTNATNELDTRNFSHAVMRRLPAEVAVDAMQLATAADTEIANFQTGVAKRAIGPGVGYGANGGGRNQTNYALATFGKPARETNCDCERSFDPSLLQTLYLRNDREMLALIDRRGGWLESVARQYKWGFNTAAPPNNPAPRGDKPAVSATVPAETRDEVSKALLDKRTEFAQRVKKLNQQLAKARQAEDKIRLAKVESRLKQATVALEGVNEQIARQLKQKNQAAKNQAAQAAEDKPVVAESAGEAGRAGASGATLEERQIAELIKQVYLRSLSRPPSEEELARATAHLRDARDPVAGLRDVLWAVLNTKEFIVNH